MRGVAAVVLSVALGGLWAPPALSAPAGRVDDLLKTLSSDPSYKLRLQAALVLGRLREPRSVPGLVHALTDPRPEVRGMAAQALGEIGDAAAREGLNRAASDVSPFVRSRAAAALARLPIEPPPDAVWVPGAPGVFVVFGSVGDRTHHAGADARGKMRESLLGGIQSAPAAGERPGRPHPRGFVVDGSIKKLGLAVLPEGVEATCEVELILSVYPSHSIVIMTTGEAVVQKSRRQYRPAQKEGMELEALDNAVRSASETLVQYIRAQR